MSPKAIAPPSRATCICLTEYIRKKHSSTNVWPHIVIERPTSRPTYISVRLCLPFKKRFLATQCCTPLQSLRKQRHGDKQSSPLSDAVVKPWHSLKSTCSCKHDLHKCLESRISHPDPASLRPERFNYMHHD